MINILLAEDEDVLGRLIKEALEMKGFHVTWMRDGSAAFNEFKKLQPDICVLDVMMPVTDGFELATKIRMLDGNVPILFLTARSQTEDILKGFELGGDDYLKKPFSVNELIARIKALTGRAKKTGTTSKDTVIMIGNYTFHYQNQTLSNDNEKFHLSHKENELLYELIVNKNNAVDRNDILLKLWNDDSAFYSNSLTVYITKLRKYLSVDKSVTILNLRGVGYKLVEAEQPR